MPALSLSSRPPVGVGQIVRATVGTLLAMLAVAAPIRWLGFPGELDLFLISSIGSSAALMFCDPDAVYARPYNMFGGHIVGAFIGITCELLLQTDTAIVRSVAVALTAGAMLATRTMHPPAAATAFLAIDWATPMGYKYVFTPVTLGITIMFGVALLVNNIGRTDGRRYPATWR
jgi:CBS domain-containing membrane protein